MIWSSDIIVKTVDSQAKIKADRVYDNANNALATENYVEKITSEKLDANGITTSPYSGGSMTFGSGSVYTTIEPNVVAVSNG
jgi:hypothetical protein